VKCPRRRLGWLAAKPLRPGRLMQILLAKRAAMSLPLVRGGAHAVERAVPGGSRGRTNGGDPQVGVRIVDRAIHPSTAGRLCDAARLARASTAGWRVVQHPVCRSDRPPTALTV